MSRSRFRVAVHDPRPTSAWAMVAVASATLWVTEQLEPWAVLLQAAAIAFSLWRRRDPFHWQTSPWFLNAGMFGITSATILVALRGEPSTIALAHFAALTQGLQLLDARPRRTEFLLVALALFQVVLAANLTDSVFFTPLLVAFVLATVWTLLVHTLRSEALEAGQAADLPRAFTPGLWRTTLFASMLSLVLALALFVVLPRLRSHVVQGPGLGASMATAGFSDRVAFGTLGEIRADTRVVMRVETLDGPPPKPMQAYWRGLAFDHFDGEAWSITPSSRHRVPGSVEGGVELGRDGQRFNLVQRIVREPVASGVLFRVGQPRGVQGPVRRLERDISGGYYAASQSEERVRYTLRSWHAPPSQAQLASDRALAPRRRKAEHLQLPALGAEVAALAQRIVAGAEGDAARARAIEAHLLRYGLYTDTPPAPDPEAEPGGPSPVERFLLGDLAGHCEYFASAMVILARSVGLPARLVNGFAGGRTNRIGGFVELTHSDAHAWVEVHYEQAGWVRYDPTPPDLRMRALAAPGWNDRVRDLASALELWWFQRVVGFDRSDQIGALKQAWLAWRGKSPKSTRHAPSAGRPSAWGEALDRREIAIGALCAFGVGIALTWLWRRRTRRRAAVHAEYERALRLLARRGIERPPALGTRAFARHVEERLPASAATAFRDLSEAYLRERFGGVASQADAALERFEHTLPRALARPAN